MNEKLLYKVKGGLRIGKNYFICAYRLTYPMAELQIYKDKLIIRYFGKQIELPKSKIKKIRKFFFGGFVIEHTKKDEYKYILFHTFFWRVDNILKILKRNKYAM